MNRKIFFLDKRGSMKCPNCFFDNRENVKICEQCGEIFQPALEPEDNPEELTGSASKKFRRKGRLGRFISGFFSAIFSFLITIFILLLVITILLGVLVYQCRLNIPIPPEWDFLPKVVVFYWNWVDEWQMGRCPDLTMENKIFDSELIPIFDEQVEDTVASECAPGSITFSPWSAAAGATFDISLDGFAPKETIRACWYYPSSALVNCTDLESDDQGHRETIYWSSSTDPVGQYRMDAQGECTSASVEWTIE